MSDINPPPDPEQLKRAMQESTNEKIQDFADVHTKSEWGMIAVGVLLLVGALVRWCWM